MSARGEAVGRDAALEKLRQRVLAAARRSVNEPADAEDLAQEVLIVLTTKYGHLEDPAEQVAVALGILRRKRAELWRKAARRRALGETPLPAGEEAGDRLVEHTPSPGPDPETTARARERLRLFVAAASRLDGRCREILRRKMLGASFVEIAAELGRPVNTIYSWDWRCHGRLRKLLGDQWRFVAGEEGA